VQLQDGARRKKEGFLPGKVGVRHRILSVKEEIWGHVVDLRKGMHRGRSVVGYPVPNTSGVNTCGSI